MSNSYGFDLNDYYNQEDEIIQLGAKYLNFGHMGLLLGAGASMALNLPSWTVLVMEICKLTGVPFDEKKKYSNQELKEIIDDVKEKVGESQAYLNLVKSALYNGVNFDFGLAKMPLLIALSALIIGKRRGNVETIFTYNFDSVLEWYLKTLGLMARVITKKDLLLKSCDVSITHIHGYLPQNDALGENSDFLIFSNEEFVDRMMSANDYWKDSFMDFFRKHTFLTVGMSPGSLIDDVIPYLRQTNIWYNRESINRQHPYGIAILTQSSFNEKQKDKLISNGIIPHYVERDSIPEFIFKIVQAAGAAS